MKTLVRWTPVRNFLALQNGTDRWFDESFFAPEHPAMRSWRLAIDAAETEDEFILKASIPGVNQDDLEITLEDDLLTIRGESKIDETVKEADFHLRERRHGSFSRSVRFSTMINPDKVEANYENGVLTLVVPKAEAAKPKRIAIKTNGKASEEKIIDA